MAAMLLLVLGSSPALSKVNAPIEDQPGVRRYALSNGLEVVLVQTESSTTLEDEGADIQIWLAVRAGTMDEDDTQRGAAGVLERLLYQGVGGYDPATITQLLGGDGGFVVGGRPSGSMVTLDQMLLMGQATGDDRSQIESLLGLYASVLDPGSWSYENERVQRAKSELSTMMDELLSPQMRARQRWLPELLGDGRLGTRAGLPERGDIDRLDAETISGFANEYMRPSRSTLIVVGGRETLQLDALIARMLGDVQAGARGEVEDLRVGIGQAQTHARSVMSLDPELEGHMAALVWVRTRDDACLSPWSVCAASYGEEQMRAMVIDRVAGELIRHRIDRLGIASFGRDTNISVDQIGLVGQIDLLQCVVQRSSSEDWRSTLRVLLSECDRIARDGAGSEEIVRARGSLLARWHRAADDWQAQTNEERVWLVHWLVTSGRAVNDMVRWDERATRMMSSISEQEINDALRRMLNPKKVRVLAVAQGQASEAATLRPQIDALIKEVRGAPLAAIDPDWMRTLGGALLDKTSFEGKITRITQHAPSGTWGAQLGSGVDVWARATTGDEDQVVECSATLWGEIFSDGTLCEGEIDAALQAWQTPSSETRSARWLSVYMQEHGLELTARRVVGGVQLRVRANANESRAAMELLYLMLDRPMIDAQAFEAWDAQRDHDAMLADDPLERALVMLYQPTLAARDVRTITLDDAQRLLTRIVRNARLGVGIAGAIDPAVEIEQAGVLLGELVHRDSISAASATQTPATIRGREKSIELRSDDREGNELTLGMLGSSPHDLEHLRATILGAMVLSDRARALGRSRGLEDTRLDAQVIMSDALGDRWALTLRARGRALGEAESVLHEAMALIASEGIGEQELAEVKGELDRSFARYFDRAGYWSRRLSELGLNGRDVQDLWSIREGYAGIDAPQASEAIRDAINKKDRFRVLIEGTESR